MSAAVSHEDLKEHQKQKPCFPAPTSSRLRPSFVVAQTVLQGRATSGLRRPPRGLGRRQGRSEPLQILEVQSGLLMEGIRVSRSGIIDEYDLGCVLVFGYCDP